MDAKTTYLENKILEHNLKNTSYTSPTTVYLALFTAAPTDAGGGTEVTGGSYARVALTFASAASGSITTSATADFTDLPAAVITHAAIMDASTSGNMLYYGALSSSITTNSGSNVSFGVGDITVGEQ